MYRVYLVLKQCRFHMNLIFLCPTPTPTNFRCETLFMSYLNERTRTNAAAYKKKHPNCVASLFYPCGLRGMRPLMLMA